MNWIIIKIDINTIVLILKLGFSTGQDAECGLHKFFISFNMIICMVISVLSILPKVQEVSLEI